MFFFFLLEIYVIMKNGGAILIKPDFSIFCLCAGFLSISLREG